MKTYPPTFVFALILLIVIYFGSIAAFKVWPKADKNESFKANDITDSTWATPYCKMFGVTYEELLKFQYDTTTGNYNTTIGSHAQFLNTTGSYERDKNTGRIISINGTYIGIGLTTGNYNTIIRTERKLK